MGARVDHLVWYSAELSAGEAFFESRLGCKPAFGGVHAGEATRNSLLSLGDTTYIEILSRDPQQPESGLDSELRRIEGAGLYHWAVGGLDLAAVVAKARSSGLKTSDVTSGGRDLPGGGRVNWQLAGIRDHRFGALVPFFIDWAGSTHPGATAPRAGRLGAFRVFTPDASSLRRLYEGVGLGQIDVRESEEPGIEAELIGHDKRLIVRSIRPLPRGFVI